MTAAEEREVIRICGPDYDELDIPTFIRNRDNEQISNCCYAPLIGEDGNYICAECKEPCEAQGMEIKVIPIPIIQGRDSCARAEADYLETRS